MGLSKKINYSWVPTLIQWSKQNFSTLPWRQKRSAYSTLVSELMLQQTTVNTVIPLFQQFMILFPSLQHLAKACEEDVLKAWTGLGYYRRAKNLWKAAQVMVEEHQGLVPHDYKTLLTLNGVGEYTAKAILSIGYDQQVLPIDTNVERVLARLLGLKIQDRKSLHLEITKQVEHDKSLFQGLSEPYPYGDFSEALMDLGRTYCGVKKKQCLLCPVQKNCQAFQLNEVDLIPWHYQEKEKIALQRPLQLDLLRIWIEKDGHVLMYQKTKGEWLEKQWDVPTFVVKSDDQHLNQYPQAPKNLLKIELTQFSTYPHIKTTITKYKIINGIKQMKSTALPMLQKVDRYKDKLVWISLTSPDRAVAAHIQKFLKVVRQKEKIN